MAIPGGQSSVNSAVDLCVFLHLLLGHKTWC